MFNLEASRSFLIPQQELLFLLQILLALLLVLFGVLPCLDEEDFVLNDGLDRLLDAELDEFVYHLLARVHLVGFFERVERYHHPVAVLGWLESIKSQYHEETIRAKGHYQPHFPKPYSSVEIRGFLDHFIFVPQLILLLLFFVKFLVLLEVHLSDFEVEVGVRQVELLYLLVFVLPLLHAFCFLPEDVVIQLLINFLGDVDPQRRDHDLIVRDYLPAVLRILARHEEVRLVH